MSDRDDRLEESSEEDRLAEEELTEEELAEEELAEGDGWPGEARALRALVDEVRAAPVPDLDWERVEQSLAERIERDRFDLGARRRRLVSSLFVAVAAAAVWVFAFSGLFEQRTDLSSVPQTDGAYRVSALAPATAIDSGAEPMQFTIPGVVSWTLAPHSRVIVDTVAVPHTISLEKGRVDAEVVPRAPGDLVEVFAVVAGTTRVAVRGTIFSVARDQTTVTVEVTRGKVAVGPVGGQAAELLVSPARARFSLEGQLLSQAQRGSEEEASTKGPGQPTAANEVDPPGEARSEGAIDPGPHPLPGSSTPGSSPPESSAPEAEVPPPAETAEKVPAEQPARISVGAARGMILGCLRSALAGAHGEGREITVSSAVTVTLGPEGRVDAVRFSPPLRPDLQQRCGGSLFGQRLEGEGKASFHVAVTP